MLRRAPCDQRPRQRELPGTFLSAGGMVGAAMFRNLSGGAGCHPYAVPRVSVGCNLQPTDSIGRCFLSSKRRACTQGPDCVRLIAASSAAIRLVEGSHRRLLLLVEQCGDGVHDASPQPHKVHALRRGNDVVVKQLHSGGDDEIVHCHGKCPRQG